MKDFYVVLSVELTRDELAELIIAELQLLPDATTCRKIPRPLRPSRPSNYLTIVLEPGKTVVRFSHPQVELASNPVELPFLHEIAGSIIARSTFFQTRRRSGPRRFRSSLREKYNSAIACCRSATASD